MGRGAAAGWARERHHSPALPHICKFPSKESNLEDRIGVLIFRGRVNREELRSHLGTGPWK